jgi:hypothetical protein
MDFESESAILELIYQNSFSYKPFSCYTVEEQNAITEMLSNFNITMLPDEYFTANFIMYLFKFPAFTQNLTELDIEHIAYEFSSMNNKTGILFIRNNSLLTSDIEFYMAAVLAKNIELLDWLYVNNFRRIDQEDRRVKHVFESAIDTGNAQLCLCLLKMKMFPPPMNYIEDYFQERSNYLMQSSNPNEREMYEFLYEILH